MTLFFFKHVNGYITQVRKESLQQFLVYMQNQGKASLTLRREFKAVNAFVNWYVENNTLTKNPVRGIKTSKAQKKPPHMVTISKSQSRNWRAIPFSPDLKKTYMASY